MAKRKNTPVHNMRLAIYALVAFVALLAMAVISVSTSNNTAMTTTTEAASNLRCAKSAFGQAKGCTNNTFRRVLITCHDGTRTSTRVSTVASCGYSSNSSTCMTQEQIDLCADKFCQSKNICAPKEIPTLGVSYCRRDSDCKDVRTPFCTNGYCTRIRQVMPTRIPSPTRRPGGPTERTNCFTIQPNGCTTNLQCNNPGRPDDYFCDTNNADNSSHQCCKKTIVNPDR